MTSPETYLETLIRKTVMDDKNSKQRFLIFHATSTSAFPSKNKRRSVPFFTPSVMTAVFEDDASTQAYVSINLIITVVGSLTSLFMILVIHRMKANTGHVLLLLYMSYFQLVYDVFCFTANVDCGFDARVTAYFFHLSTGIAVSIISNWIAFVALYIVFFREKFDVVNNIYWIITSAVIPGLASGIFYLVAALHAINDHDDLVTVSVSQVYNNIRLASVFLNFFFVSIIVYKIEIMSSKMTRKSPQEEAIRTLAYRMIYYPIVQAIGRSGYAWYELTYGPYMEYHHVSTEQYSSLIFLSIITPIVSVGYLIIFIVMQPTGYEHCKALLTCQPVDPTKIQHSVESRRQTNSLKFSTDQDDHDGAPPRYSFTDAFNQHQLQQTIKHVSSHAAFVLEEALEAGSKGNVPPGPLNPSLHARGSSLISLDLTTGGYRVSQYDQYDPQAATGGEEEGFPAVRAPEGEGEDDEALLYYILEHPVQDLLNPSQHNNHHLNNHHHHHEEHSSATGGVLAAVVNILHASKSSESLSAPRDDQPQPQQQQQTSSRPVPVMSHSVELTPLPSTPTATR